MEILNKIQRELKAPKGQFNSFGKYHYRSCEDILEAVKPLLGEAILTITDDIIQIGERYYVKAIVTLTEGDKQISVSAFARESLDKKGMDASQITGATSSYARKYALNGLFLIDDTKDADTRDNTNKTEKAAKTTKRASSSPKEEPEPRVLTEEEIEAEEKLKTPNSICFDCEIPITQKVRDYSKEHFGRALCFDCQKKEKNKGQDENA